MKKKRHPSDHHHQCQAVKTWKKVKKMKGVENEENTILHMAMGEKYIYRKEIACRRRASMCMHLSISCFCLPCALWRRRLRHHLSHIERKLAGYRLKKKRDASSSLSLAGVTAYAIACISCCLHNIYIPSPEMDITMKYLTTTLSTKYNAAYRSVRRGVCITALSPSAHLRET